MTIINRIKPEITGAGNSCTAYQETYSINENPGYNYKWSVNLGTIIGKDNQGTVIIRWEAPGTGKLKIIIDNLSQCQDSSEISVTINPAPPKPSISVTNGKLISDSQYGNLWFLDGVSLPDTLNAITPVIDGNYTVRVTNQFACYSESSEPFSFENNSDFIVFSIDTISAYSGDNFFLNIRMLKNKKFYESNISKLSATLVCNSSMLFPLGDDKGAVVKGKRYLNLNLDTNYITENIIASLPFMAMLGDAETSTITLDRVRINGIPELNTKVRTGLFSMLGICYDGGPRLITSTLASEILSINPNPASRELNIEIFVGNDEDIKLELINNNGVVEKLFLSKHLKMGYYQFTYYVNEFSNGEYFVKLQSGTSVSSNKIILSK